MGSASPGQLVISRFVEQRQQPLGGGGIDPIGDALDDGAVGSDQGVRATALDGGEAGNDDLAAPELGHEIRRQPIVGTGALRYCAQPGQGLLADGAFERSVAVELLQGDRVLVTRRLPLAVTGKRLAGKPDLGADERQHGLGDHFARLQQAAWVAERAQLERKAEPVLRAPAAADMTEVDVIEDMLLQQRRLVGGKRQQRVPLPAGQNGAPGHDGLSQLN